MAEINFNMKQRKTSFKNILDKYLHFASNKQLQPANSQRFIRNAVEILHEQSSRKFKHLKKKKKKNNC